MKKLVSVVVVLLCFTIQGWAQRSFSSVEEKLRYLYSLVESQRYYANDSLLHYAKQQLTLAESTGNQKEIGLANLSLFYAYLNNQNNEKALQHIFKAKEIFESTSNKKELAVVYIELGSVLKESSTFSVAFSHLHQALIYFKSLKDTSRLLNAYYELSLLYRNSISRKELARDSVIFYNLSGLKMAILQKDTFYIHRFSNNMADLHLVTIYDYDLYKSLTYSFQVLRSPRIEQRNQSVALLNTGLVYLRIGKTDSALYYALKGYEISHKIRPTRLLSQACNLLYKIYEEKGLHKEALFYYTNYVKNSYYISQIENLLAVLEMQNRDIKIIQQSKELDHLKINTQQSIIYTLLGVLILLSISAFIIYKKNKTIKEGHAEILQKKEQIEFLIKEVHHRIKNNLQMIVGLLDLQKDMIQDEHIAFALNDASSRVKSIALVHQKLYSGDNSSVTIGFKSYVKDLFDNLMFSYNKADFITLKMEVEEIETSFDKAVMLGLLLTELIINSLKHAFFDRQPGIINIIIKKADQQHLQITIKDNGVGLPKDFNAHSGFSFGMDIIHSLVSNLKGEIAFTTQNGTTIDILLHHFFQRKQKS